MKPFAVIINQQARNAGNFQDYSEVFEQKNLVYKLYKIHPDDLEQTIKQCIKSYSLIIVGGGDGTIRAAAQWCANTSVILGIIPLGTLNHFAKELTLPETAEDLCKNITHPTTITIDLAEMNGLVFINNSSLGFYPSFAKKRIHYNKFYNKWLSYIPGFIQTLRRHRRYSMSITNDKNIKLHLKTSFLMISNNLYSYQFPLSIKRVNFKDKLLGIYFLKHGKFQLRKIFRHLFNNSNEFDIKNSALPLEVNIKGYKSITLSLDGETTQAKLPLKYKVLPQALKILVMPS